MANKDSSLAALNAINKIADKRFSELQYIQQQFLWSTIYLPSDEVEKPTTNTAKLMNDPRFLYAGNKDNISYLQFVAKNNVEQQFIYTDDNGNLNNIDIVRACDEIINRVDFTKSKIKNDEKYIMQLLAGIKYLNKWSMFTNKMSTIHNIKSSYLTILNQQINNGIQEYVNILARHFGYSEKEISSKNMYIECPSCSFASSELKQQYSDTKKEYLQMLNELYEIIKQSPQLSVCYANAGGTEVSAGKNSDVYVNLRQVVNCAGDIVSNEVVNGELSLAELAKEIKVVKNSIMSKDDIIALIDSKIVEKMDEEKNKIQVGTTLIIIIIVLFIFSFVSLILSTYNFKKIKSKLHGKCIDKFDYNRLMNYLN
jgi:hypothetical protein